MRPAAIKAQTCEKDHCRLLPYPQSLKFQNMVLSLRYCLNGIVASHVYFYGVNNSIAQ